MTRTRSERPRDLGQDDADCPHRLSDRGVQGADDLQPLFEKAGIDAVVMPMGVQAADYPNFLRELFKVTNIRGALVTMPHKKTTIELADEVSPTARIAGAANALLKREDGSLLADMFDGEGFVRGVSRRDAS